MIPVQPSVPFQRFRLTLDGREYVVRLKWSTRVELWSLELYTTAEDLLASTYVVANADLFAAVRADPRVPQGRLLALSVTTPPVDPGFADFGDGIDLVYLTAAEAAAEGV